jgi:hypothetical protein
MTTLTSPSDATAPAGADRALRALRELRSTLAGQRDAFAGQVDRLAAAIAGDDTAP